MATEDVKEKCPICGTVLEERIVGMYYKPTDNFVRTCSPKCSVEYILKWKREHPPEPA